MEEHNNIIVNNSIADIKNNIIEWCNTNLTNFSFRQYQLESICTLINNIINNKRETTIIEAPTGSGKSLICLITAGVLSTYYKMSSYILCSDLYLWKQYADFIDNMHLPFGKLMGSKGNYVCEMNNQDISISICKLKGVSYKQLMDGDTAGKLGFSCAWTCKYIKERKKAIRSHVTLMTYQLWLNYLNYTDREIFGERNVIFCDECHNIPSIIQMFCQPTINPKYHFSYLEEILSNGMDMNISIQNPDKKEEKELFINVKDLYTLDGLHESLATIFNNIYNTEDKSIILSEYSEYFRIVNNIKCVAEEILQTFGSKVKKQKELTKSEQKLIHVCDTIIEYRESLYDFMRAISICGDTCLSYLVKTNNLDKEMNRSIVFACSKEDLLCNEYMLKNSPYKVMLSATVGAHEAFNENIGIKYTKSTVSEMFRIPSTFDFSKSPIYYLPKFKMSKDTMETNFPFIQKIIMNIVSSNKHNEEKGMIHTGSYKNALKLYEMMPEDIRSRMFIYANAKEKNDILYNFENSDNGILVGPTLTEGIDMPDDGCRFIIIMKIPYPNLGDNLVLSKVKLFPKWYNSETSNTVIQAIGRGNRTPNDWCTTYILDGNFGRLYAETISQYAPELQKRIIVLNS